MNFDLELKNETSTLYSKGSGSNSDRLDESINQIEQLLQQHADEITAWQQGIWSYLFSSVNRTARRFLVKKFFIIR